jgi:hypothetical protein
MIFAQVLFDFDWKQWVSLGMSKAHVSTMSMRQIGQVFALPYDEQACSTAHRMIAVQTQESDNKIMARV